MKKIIIFIGTLAFISCSKDDPKEPEGNLYGKWNYSKIEVNGTLFPYDDHETCGKDYIEFFDTDKIKSVDIFGCQPEIEWIGSFSKTNSNLVITREGETVNCTILTLTSNTLVYDFDVDVDGNGSIDHCIQTFDK